MAEHPNAAVVRRLSEAFESGDMAITAAVGEELMADDIVWHEIGRAEPRRGKAELRAAMGEVDYVITGKIARHHRERRSRDHPCGCDGHARRQDAPLPGRRDLPRPERQDHRAVGLLRRHGGHHRVLRLSGRPLDQPPRMGRPRGPRRSGSFTLHGRSHPRQGSDLVRLPRTSLDPTSLQRHLLPDRRPVTSALDRLGGHHSKAACDPT